MLIFLDFDGVLHSAHAFRAEQMFSQLSVFEPFFRQPEFANIQFVVSSTWRHNRSLEELRAPFSADFRARIVGKTPEYVAHRLLPSANRKFCAIWKTICANASRGWHWTTAAVILTAMPTKSSSAPPARV